MIQLSIPRRPASPSRISRKDTRTLTTHHREVSHGLKDDVQKDQQLPETKNKTGHIPLLLSSQTLMIIPRGFRRATTRHRKNRVQVKKKNDPQKNNDASDRFLRFKIPTIASSPSSKIPIPASFSPQQPRWRPPHANRSSSSWSVPSPQTRTNPCKHRSTNEDDQWTNTARNSSPTCMTLKEDSHEYISS